MHRLSHLFPAVTLFALAIFFVQFVHAEEPDEVKRVRKVGQGLVYRIEAGNNQGSAVLLEVVGQDLYIATCYHVMIGAKGFRLIDATITEAYEGKVAKYHAVPYHDLVIFKIDKKQAKGLLKEVDTGSLAYKEANFLNPRQEQAALRPLPQGFILGFPFYNNSYLDVDVAKVDPKHSSVKAFDVLNPIEARIQGKSDPTKGLDFGYVGLRPTVPGMSGGLVQTNELEFAGLIFGRIPDTVGLMIPRPFVEAALQEAKRGKLTDISEADFPRESSPFSDSVLKHLNSSEISSVIEWDEYAHWSNYFQDPAPFREAFQEIVLNSELLAGKTGKDTPPLSLRIGGRSFEGGEAGKQKVSLWVNGRAGPELAIDKGGLVDLAPYLVPGENLLIVSKEKELPDFRNEFNLSKLLSSSRLDFDVMAGDRTVCHVVRSLPGLARNYSVYITLQIPSKPEPYHARLVARMDWIQDVLGNPTHNWNPKDVQDPRTGSFAKGFVNFQPQDDKFLEPLRKEWERSWLDNWVPKGALGLRPRSSQTLDTVVLAEIHLKEFYANYLGTKVAAKPSKPLRLLLRGRVQLVRGPNPDKGFFLCVRAVSAYTDAKLDVPLLKLGDVEVQADLAGVLQEAFLNWINSEFLHPDRPLPLIPSPPKGATAAFRPAQVFVLDNRIVATFQLYDPANRLVLPNARVEDPTKSPFDPLTLLDFEGWNVRAAALPLETLLGKDNRDPILAEMARVQSPLPSFHIDLKKTSKTPVAAGTHTLDEDVNVMAEHFRQLFLKEWDRESKTLDARISGDTLTALLVGRFNKGTIVPVGVGLRGEVDLARSGETTTMKGKKLHISLMKLSIGRVTLDGVDLDVADLSLTAKGSELSEGRVTLKLNKADLTLPDGLGVFKNIRCDSISLSWQGKDGVQIQYKEAPFDGGKLHEGTIRLDNNGQVGPNNN
jgi:hypothetical protein